MGGGAPPSFFDRPQATFGYQSFGGLCMGLIHGGAPPCIPFVGEVIPLERRLE